MFSHIIVGATGTGKTTFVKSLLKKVDPRNLYIYDVNNEYTEFYDSELENFGEFSKRATELKNAVIVFEEATIFLNNRSSNQELTNILVRKRHTNNTIFLCFHSLRSIPRNIYEISTHITIFKTSDNPELVLKKFEDERMYKAVQEVHENYVPPPYNRNKKPFKKSYKIY